MDKKKIGAIVGVIGVAGAIGATQLVDINRTAADNIHEKLAEKYENQISSSLPETGMSSQTGVEESPEEEKPQAESLEEREIERVARGPEYLVGQFETESKSQSDMPEDREAVEEAKPIEEHEIQDPEEDLNHRAERPDVPVEKPEIAFQGKVTAENLNIRKEANKESETIGSLNKDDIVIGTLKDGWVSFVVEEQKAYVDASFLQVLTDQELEEHKAIMKKKAEEAAKAAEEAAKKAEEERKAAEEARKKAEEEEKIRKEQEERQATEAARKEQEAKEKAEAEARAKAQQRAREEADKAAKEGKKVVGDAKGYIKYPVVNVRADADSNSRIVGSLYLNDRVEGKLLKNSWIKLNINGKDVYISNGLLSDKKTEVKVEEKKVSGYVSSANGLNVRSGAGEGYSTLGILSINDYVEGVESDGWIKINFNGNVGYVIKSGISSRRQKVESSKTGSSDNSSNDKKQNSGNMSLVDIAKEKIGLPYQWGGTGNPGFDCSGFTQYIYKQIGVRLPHKASIQATYGYDVAKEDLRSGDLVFFRGSYGNGDISHVGMYIGGGMIIHASTGTGSITIDYLYGAGYFTNNYVKARRILN